MIAFDPNRTRAAKENPVETGCVKFWLLVCQARFTHTLQKMRHRPGRIGHRSFDPGKGNVGLHFPQHAQSRFCFLDKARLRKARAKLKTCPEVTGRQLHGPLRDLDRLGIPAGVVNRGCKSGQEEDIERIVRAHPYRVLQVLYCFVRSAVVYQYLANVSIGGSRRWRIGRLRRRSDRRRARCSRGSGWLSDVISSCTCPGHRGARPTTGPACQGRDTRFCDKRARTH